MTILTWKNFSKRVNSTKTPSGGTSHTVTLKGGCSVERPVFILTSSDYEINYVKAFDRYYFVTDLNLLTNNHMEIICDLDVGATYKSAIGGYTAFVERSATYSDPMIPDPFVTVKNEEIIWGGVYGSSSYIFSSTGMYAVSVLNDRGSGAGFTTTYFMTAGEMMQLAQYCNVDWGNSAVTLLDWFQSNYLHTADSVIDCVWIPVSASAIISGSVSYEEVKIGVDQVTSVYGYRATGPVVATDTEYISIPNYYTVDFRKGSPYQKGKLFLPCFGCIDFNPIDFPNDQITVKFDVDCCTGDTVVYISNDSGYLLATYMYNIGVTCPVGKVNQNVSGVSGGIISTIASGAAAIASGGATAVASGISATASAINTIASAVEPMTSYRGSKGGRAAAHDGLMMRIAVIAKVTTDPTYLTYVHGLPFMQYRQISNFSGYVKCSGADVPIDGTENEKIKVNNMLNTGFYYE